MKTFRRSYLRKSDANAPPALVSRLMPTLRIPTAPVFRPLLEPVKPSAARYCRDGVPSGDGGKLVVWAFR
jgi:hypothetical protein